MKTQIPNIDVVRSAWRRVKKDIKDAIIRDLKPVKDVKGGGGFEANPNPPKAALAPRAATKKDKELHAASVVRPIRFPRDVNGRTTVGGSLRAQR
jgi:hypothetical protein